MAADGFVDFCLPFAFHTGTLYAPRSVERSMLTLKYCFEIQLQQILVLFTFGFLQFFCGFFTASASGKLTEKKEITNARGNQIIVYPTADRVWSQRMKE